MLNETFCLVPVSLSQPSKFAKDALVRWLRLLAACSVEDGDTIVVATVEVCKGRLSSLIETACCMFRRRRWHHRCRNRRSLKSRDALVRWLRLLAAYSVEDGDTIVIATVGVYKGRLSSLIEIACCMFRRRRWHYRCRSRRSLQRMP